MAGFLRKLSSFFRGKGYYDQDEETQDNEQATGRFRHTKTVQRDVDVPEPVIAGGGYGGGGIQGLSWYVQSLKEDDDGFIADQFFVEPFKAITLQNRAGQTSGVLLSCKSK
ncbi:hypothetical protein CYMTET_37731 [Cymbomonas tetramitiformis]|uniref:Uncharacterized protein n=1 Tax=Cymbomonas tetramitiformis TaxID=36881 RepID=A0AAE0CFJ4_9CHLO|nr:hypothetical protein CYMTET_37731 [Cymbomonas tetramitiformis]